MLTSGLHGPRHRRINYIYMCYSTEMATAQIGVRELQQHASKYLDLVENGQVIEVTRHGRRIARLEPFADPGDPYARLYAAGLLIPPTEGGDLLDIVPVPPVPGTPSMQEIFDEARDERL
jgi:prevent-host-death family protein